jgi:hypothetical protein
VGRNCCGENWCADIKLFREVKKLAVVALDLLALLQLGRER